MLLERKRTDFYLSTIKSTTSKADGQEYSLLFRIGEEDNIQTKTYSSKTLGFSEVYFQYMI